MQHPNAAAVAFLFLLSSAPALIADILVLDRAAKTVSRLDTPSLTVKASTPLPDVPERVVLSPDGATAVVLCRGEGDDKHDGFQARTKAQAIILEAASLKERARIELGWGLGPAIWDAAGRALVVLSPGFGSTNPAKQQPASVVSVDLAGTPRRVQLDRAAVEMAIAPDGNVAAVLSTRVDGPSQLAFADLATGTAGNAAFLEGEPKELLLAPDGVTLYVLDRGQSKTVVRVGTHRRRRGKDAPGSLAVFSLAERRKTGDIPLGAITAIGGFDRTGRLILGGATAEDAKEHSIYVVKGDAIEWEVPGPSTPAFFRFSPDGRTAWAFGSSSAFVDFADFSAPPKVSIVSVHGRGPSFETTPDEKLVLTYYSDGKSVNEATVYELPSGKKLKSFDTASFGSRLGTALLAVGATVASIDAGRREAETHGRSTYTYSIYTPRTKVPRGAPIVIRPDGKVAFVYDPFGSEILSLDLEKLEKGKRQAVGSGSRGLFLIGGGKTLLAASERGLSVFDTALFEKTGEMKTDGPADIVMGPSGETLLLAKGLVATINPATGKLAARATSFGLPVIGAFLP
jgi:DNA-binding beta-propeller fold protein YncE